MKLAKTAQALLLAAAISYPVAAEAFEMPANEIYMPLSEQDFDGGQKHYFLVGSRLGQWRLQPEWELLAQPDGTVGLDNRLITSGFFAVAVVDNYTDYTRHLFRLYGPSEEWGDWINKTFWVKDLPGNDDDDVEAHSPSWHRSAKRVGLQPFTDGKFTGQAGEGLYSDIRFGWRTYSTESGLYNDEMTHYQFGDNNNQLHNGNPKKAFNFVTPLLDNPESNADPNEQTGRENNGPAYVGKIRVALDGNGLPQTITLSEVSKDMNVIDRYRAISFVGGGFRNVDNDPGKTDYRSPRARFYSEEDIMAEIDRQSRNDQSANLQIFGFADGWIQYDRQGRPYVDAYGEFLYHTCYQPQWLTSNFSYMKNSNGFEYTSDNLVFKYDEARTAARVTSGKYNFGQAENGETVYYYNEGNKEQTTRDLGSDLKCYTVENVWINGSFNLWTGFGGNTLDFMVAGREDAHRNDAHWNIDNGSTHTAGQDRVVYALPGTDDRDRGDIYFATYANWAEGRFAAGVKGNSNGIAQVNGADKTVLGLNDGTPEFFDRVEIWWKPGYGNDHRFAGGAVVRFVQTPGGPNIWISRTGGNSLGYNYNIPETSRNTVNQPLIAWYKIERIAIVYNEDGTEDLAAATTVEDVEVAQEENLTQDKFYAYIEREKYRNDPAYIPAGDYRYRITVRYWGDETEYPAISNKVTVTPQNLSLLYSHLKGTYTLGNAMADHTLQINAELFDGEGNLLVDFAETQYAFRITAPDGAVTTSTIEGNEYGEAPYFDFTPEQAGIYRISAKAIWNEQVYYADDNYPVFAADGTLPGSDLTADDAYYVSSAWERSGTNDKVIKATAVHTRDTEPTHAWTKFEDYSIYENGSSQSNGNNWYWRDHSDNPSGYQEAAITNPNKPFGTQQVSVSNNNTDTHDCCNFSRAYYRYYASHPDARPAETASRISVKAHVSTSDITNTRVARTLEVADNTTGVSDITAEGAQDGETAWYTLQGIRLQGQPTTAGAYLKVSGRTATKEIVK